MAAPDHHKILIEGFHAIVDKNGLGWAVLDSKSEQLVTSAIATSINRKLGRRIAHVEFSTRIDLAILQTPIRHRERRCLDPGSVAVEMQYEAKIGHSFDFAPAQSTHEKYLGADLNRDMEGMSYGRGAGLFFVSDARDANRQQATLAAERWRLCVLRPGLDLVVVVFEHRESIDGELEHRVWARPGRGASWRRVRRDTWVEQARDDRTEGAPLDIDGHDRARLEGRLDALAETRYSRGSTT